MAGVNAVCSSIDLGVVELNDLVSSASYQQLVEMQNFVYRDSRSMVYSFAYDDGAGVGWVAPADQVFAIFEVDIPEGIDQILITSRAESAKLVFLDVTAGVTMATNSHGSPADTKTATYLIPAPGVRLFSFGPDGTGGTISAVLIEWDAQTIP
jgi:hypothetical protein